MKIKKEEIFINILFCLVIGNLICNYAFTNVGIKVSKLLIPFNELIAFIGMVRLFSKGYFLKVVKGSLTFFFFLIIVSFVVVIPFDFIENGIFALRDGTHQIDICFFFIVQNEMYIYLKKLKSKKKLVASIFKKINNSLNMLFVYSLFRVNPGWLLNISPKITGVQKTFSLLGNFNNTHIWLLLLMVFNVLKLKKINKKRQVRKIFFLHFQNIISLLIICYSTSRITIGTYLFLILLFFFIKEFKLSKLLLGYFSFLAVIVILLLVSGVEIQLRRGVFNAGYLSNMVLSIVGKGEIRSMAGGVHQRVEWISKLIIDDFTIKNLFFGQGFGMPLTNFYAGGAIVREPHNSLITLYARQGIIVAIGWLLGLMNLFFKFLKNKKKRNIASVLGMSLIVIALLNSLVEPFFELPYNAVIFYILLGILTFLSKSKNYEKT